MQVFPQDLVTAAVATSLDLDKQLSGISAALVPPLVQIGLVILENAATEPGPVVDQQLVRAGSAGEPTGGAASLTQVCGYAADAAALGEQLMHRFVAQPGAHGGPVGPLGRPQRHRGWCWRGGRLR